MATIIRDGFDFYSSGTAGASDAQAGGYWDTAAAVWGNEWETRFGIGKSLGVGNVSTLTTILSKTFGSNESTVFFTCAVYGRGTLSGSTSRVMTFQLRDGASAQVSLILRSDGSLEVRTGDTSGTVLGTFAGAFAGGGVWTHLQFKVVVNSTTGSVEFRKNGNSSNDYALTGVNTRGGTTNAYANAVYVIGTDNINYPPTNLAFDDMYVHSGSGAAPTSWLGDVRAVPLYPTTDTAQKDFTALGTTVTTGHSPTGGTVSAISSNTMRSLALIYPPAGTIGTVTVSYNANPGGSAKHKVALYDSDGANGAPGTLLGISNEVTGGTSPIAYTFASPVSTTAARGLWIVYMSDSSITPATLSNTNFPSSIMPVHTQSRTYASDFPATMTPTASTGRWLMTTSTVTIATNCGEVLDLSVVDGVRSYVYDSTVNNKDLYDVTDLTFTPSSVLGVTVRAFMAKSDAGARSAAVTMKSSSTDQDGPTLALSTSYTMTALHQDVDPATSSAWTPTAVNNVQVGIKTVS